MDRETHGILWRDDLAWMEEMKGERWNSFLTQEREKWNKCVKGVKGDVPLFMAEVMAAREPFSAPMFQSAGGTVEISLGGTHAVSWRFKGEQELLRSCTALEARRGGYVWTIEEVGNGAEVYAVRAWKRGNPKPLWEHRGVGPYVAVVGSRCYCLQAKNRLVYYKLVSWDASTGKDEQTHYEEKDYRYNLELLRGDSTHAHLRRQSGAKQVGFVIVPEDVYGLEPISLDSQRFVYGCSAREYLVWSKKTGWRASSALTKWHFPSFQNAVPETLDTARGLLVTKWNGYRTLWKISRSSPPFTLWRDVGQILIDPWEGPWVRFTQPGMDVVWWNSKGADRPHTSLSFCRLTEWKSTKSLDGSSVPYILVKPFTKAEGLLVVGYGAYGMSTPLTTSRWEPLLKRGWAIAIGLWRGGGDHTPEWEDAGRIHGRERVLEDAEAVVRAAQKEVECTAKNTVLYGRSAGGLWVGGLVAKYANGTLARGAYMEVPYLDVLRTITNRTLPLTEIETDEFGLPDQRLSDFRSALNWSPMSLVPEEGVKGVWQLVRTGLNDSEVFAYESAKWVKRCGEKAILALENGQGHFVSGAVGLEQQATDLAVLLHLAGDK